MSEGKQVWQRPELVVLVRSRPEEAVLAGCKYLGVGGPGRPSVQACTHPSQGDCISIGVS
jgi:hypothetical protein